MCVSECVILVRTWRQVTPQSLYTIEKKQMQGRTEEKGEEEVKKKSGRGVGNGL